MARRNRENADAEAEAVNDDPSEGEAADAGADEVQAAMDEATEQGYVGTVPDPLPNSAYSQESDPMTSPGTIEAERAVAEARAARLDREAPTDEG